MEPTSQSKAARLVLSPEEYDYLHRRLIARSDSIKRSLPEPSTLKTSPSVSEAYNTDTIRISLRLFLSSYAGLKLYDTISQRFLGAKPPQTKPRFFNSPSFRLSLSFSTILFLHRTLHRFFKRLRASLQSQDARPFKRRNPRISAALSSTIAPALGASALAGLALGIAPADQTRLTITIYFLSRSLEFLYNKLEADGLFKNRPSWFGSWLIMPFACGQLLHAFVFDRDCFPAAYGAFILKRSPEYVAQRPVDLPADVAFPGTFDIVDALGRTSQLKWPGFTSPILFPATTALTSAGGLNKIAPLTDPAHPALKHLSCATLHPTDPSCSRTLLKYYLQAFPVMTKFWTAIYVAFSLPAYKSFAARPMSFTTNLAKKITRTSMFLTSAIGTAWSSICLLQRILPGSVLSTQRWFISGFLAGLWGWLEKDGGRSNFLYSLRMSMDSTWKVGKKRGWWKGFKGSDVIVFAMAFACVGTVYEINPEAIDSAPLRKGLGLMRGDGWVDRAAVDDGKKDDKKSR